jgi:hypothetical protein
MGLIFFLLTVMLGLPCVATAKDMTFEIVYMNHTNVVVADGDITAKTPEAFQAFLDTSPFDGFRFVVALNSGGGSLVGGMRLGQMIRESGLDTTVEAYPPDATTGKPGYATRPGQCYSACAIAFLGGVRRAKPEEAKLGFHQFSSAGGSFEVRESVYMTEAVAQLMGATVLGYILKMGGEPELFTRLSETLPHEMWEPRTDDLIGLKIITRETFQGFEFEPYGKGVISYAQSAENVAGRSVVGQITAYCKAGVPYVLLSALKLEHGTDARTRSLIAEEQNGYVISAEGRGKPAKYGPGAVNVRLSEGLPLAELQFDARGVDLVTHGPVLIRVDFPAAVGAIFALRTTPSQRDLATLSAAFRLCFR